MTDNERGQMLPEGTLLKDGEYRVVGYMASGGFGNTYEVEHEGRLHKHMAVKEFFIRGVNTRQGTHVTVSVEDNRADFNRMQRKFFAEAERLAQLDHPHIVEVSDFFEENDTAYYVMKLISGQPLNKVMAEHGAMGTDRVCDILRQVLSALKYVHAQHLYHLDLKPANIMQNAEGHCWLIDFGASKQMSDDDGHTLTTTALPYTPRYAPLEQVGQNMEDIGPWTDFYALGATLYHLLTAQTPPKPDKVNEDGEAAFAFPDGMDATMRRLILWMMQPRRSQRPQSVEEIERWLEVNPVGKPAAKKEEPKAAPAVKKEEPKAAPAADKDVPTVASTASKDVPTVKSKDAEPTRASSATRLQSRKKPSKAPWVWAGVWAVAAVALVLFIISRNDIKNGVKEPVEVPSAFTLCPDGNHPHAIDLGLPSGTKWACCNIGAATPEGYGDYFRWGETTPMKEGDTEATYRYEGRDIGDDISGTRYDAATANWGTDWQMPTEEQTKELMNNCSYEWTTLDGVEGAKVTGGNGRSIFLPASGYRSYSDGSLSSVGSYGYSWSASAYDSNTGHTLLFGSSSWRWSYSRWGRGFPVRAVAEE